MASMKIREYDAKRIICNNINKEQIKIKNNSILVSPETNLNSLLLNYDWLSNNKLVVKPDQLFGKRKV